jgi:MFS family permease
MPRRFLPRLSITRTIVLGFLVFGTYHSLWTTCLSELKREANLSDGDVGTLLTVGSLCSIPLQFLSGSLLHRFGAKVFPAVCLLLMANLLAVGVLRSHAELVPVFMIAAVGFGLFNISINASALHQEHVTSVRRLPTLHALFSLGGIIGSVIGGVLLAGHVRLQLIYFLPVLLMILSAVFLRAMTADLAGDDDVAKPPVFDREVVCNRALRRFVPLSMAAVMGEGILYAWPVIYLRDDLHAAAFVGASGLLVFYAAMCVGRFGLTYLQGRFGRLGVVQISGFLIAVGMGIALATTYVPLTITGFLVAGLGYSACYPNMLSIAGSIVPGRPRGVSSFVQPLGSVAGLLGPTIIGLLSDATSLRFALCLEIVIGAWIFAGVTLFARSSHAGDLRHEHRVTV